MGCGGSSSTRAGGNSETSVQKDRRRLSVGNMDSKGGPGGEGDSGEDQRGLITSLSAETILQMLKEDGPRRKFSIGSDTDLDKRNGFAKKTLQQQGDDVDPTRLGLGFTCRKGLKPESPNQDSWGVLQVDGNFSVYGVYDGHGRKGHDVSNFVRENMPKLVVRDPRFKTKDMGAMMSDHYRTMQQMVSTADRMKKISAQMSGTTCTVIIHDHAENKLLISHVADSTAVLGQYKDSSKTELRAITLTRDHKPDLPDERERIEKAGGRVVFDGYLNHRVYAKNGRYPGLNMSRCLGDLMGHADAGCSAVPEISERQICPEDHVLLLCSDGVWEFMEAMEAVEIVTKFTVKQGMEAAECLAKEAWDRWIQEEGGAVVDDITVILVWLQHAGGKGNELIE